MARDSNGDLVCPRVGKWLSPRMQTLIPHLAEAAPVEAPVVGLSVRWGGGWHCPADARQMEPEPGGVRCPDCGRRLVGSVLYELTEFNQHQASASPGSG